MLNDLRERGVCRIGLICADGLKGLEDVISEVFPGTKLQRCTTHLKRNILSDVRNGDKGEVAEDLRQVFRTGDRNCTVEQACGEWQGSNGAGTAGASASEAKMPPARRISLT